MFVDKAKITIQAGDGGNGAVSFHKEKYVNMGGPDGGNGGRGGNVYFEATRNAHTLENFRYQKNFRANRGDDGGKNNCYGKHGQDLIITVPAGTVVRDSVTNEVLLDMFEDNMKKILLRGGRGGRGNAKFATPTRQTPRFATPGQQARIINVTLELRTIADVGLVGMPNVGKSTLLALLTSAQPKIANYHFTTLAPNLGVVKIDGDRFVMADIPGLIEGASDGAGLGHDFLRHVQRTRVLLHVLDASGIEGRDPVEDYKKINDELSAFDDELAKLPQIVAANKMDLFESRSDYDRIKEELEKLGAEVFAVSAATGEGVQAMLRAVASKLRDLPELEPYDEFGELPQADTSKFKVVEEEKGIFVIEGPLAEYLMRKTNTEEIDSLRHLHRSLKKRGVIDELRAAGAKDGDTVMLFGWEFEFQDD